MAAVVIEVEVPEVFGAEKAAWHVLLDLAEARLPRWVLAGGLMVHLHLYEAGATPDRATTDVDAVVDVSVREAHATEEFSRRLQHDLHMRMEAPNADNVGHRFTRDDGGIVDVLAADFGERSRPHTTIPPATTVEVPGGRGLLAGAQQVRVIHHGRSGVLERPSLLAAIVGKWRAFTEIAVHQATPTVTFAMPPGCLPLSTRTPWLRPAGSASTCDACSSRWRPDLHWQLETVTSSSTRWLC